MKLILCRKCGDFVRLKSTTRECDCGLSWGKYINDLDAVCGGDAVMCGIANTSLARLIQNGDSAELFRIKEPCDTFKRETVKP